MARQRRTALPLGVALLLGLGSAVQLEEPPSDFKTVFSLRSEWGSRDEPCHGKLPFDLWTLMMAEGSAQSSDAKYVRASCIQTQDVGLVELITPEGYTMSEGVEAAPGDVISETENASTYRGATAATFEAFCDDENITRVARVTANPGAHASTKRKAGRRLQSSTSEAGQAHQVAELIAGLDELGCTRTTGEDQTVCVMSDSFDHLGIAEDLQASGDLPQVEVVKELPVSDDYAGTDEGSAMLELMYDISSGSTYKFNTAAIGEQTFADDIGILVNEEGCDVIVDDIGVTTDPAFRDGVISVAVDEAVGSGSLYFSSAGNDGSGYRFTSNFECADGFESIFEDAPGCGTGVPSHVFQPDATDLTRYFYPLTASIPREYYHAHWDADIETTDDVVLVIYSQDISTGETTEFQYSDGFSGVAVEQLLFEPVMNDDDETPNPAYRYYLQIAHMGLEVDEIEADFLLRVRNGDNGFGISGESDGSIYGHSCASSSITVGAIEWSEGDGPAGAFEDPETSPVEDFSSRGPCFVNGETRSKPTTSAADGVSTSHPYTSLNPFFGTSAAAPVAAAIATIVRAACFPTVVGYAEIMDMLTNYDYTIDYTNDADGAAETWGTEAGYGIISATQMLAWVEANCAAACPGDTESPTAAPTETSFPTTAPSSSSTPTTAPSSASTPTTAPVDAVTPTAAPSSSSTPTTAPSSASTPTTAPVDTPAPTAAPSSSSASTTAPSSASTPTTAPVDTPTPTAAPLDLATPTTAPVDPATAAPTSTAEPVTTPSTPSPEARPTAAPVGEEEPEVPATPPPTPEDIGGSEDADHEDEEPKDDDESGYVEVGTKTTVSVTATAFDERPGEKSSDVGCGDDGCLPALAHDGIGEDDSESRWSCSKDLVSGGGQCEIEFTFGSPQDIMDVEVDFWKGEQRIRTLKVKLNGDKIGEFESQPGSVSTSLGIQQTGVDTVTLESIGIDEDEWISLLEVRFMVAP